MKVLEIGRTQSSIALLHSLEPGNAARFGAKTAGLVSAISSGALVLPGLALSVELVSEIASGQDPQANHRLIEAWLRELARTHPGDNFIVRSSSIFENDQRCDFSGVFRTCPGIKSAEQAVLAIRDIVSDARNSKLSSFFEECGISIDCDHMGILIQPEILSRYGGVIEIKDNSATIEFTSRSISAAISGDSQYSSLFLRNGMVENTHIQKWDRNLSIEELTSLNFRQGGFWQSASHNRALVEFFVDETDLYVAQVKDRHSELLDGFNEKNDEFPFCAPASAGKFSAMRFFYENGLFDKPLYTLERGWTIEAALECAEHLLNRCQKITLRVADGVEIGLPRAFCATVDEVHTFLGEHSAKSYDLIMHGYINVERSLEILVDQDGFVVEHIPGMWESPNAHQPDVLLAKNGVITQYRFNGTRDPVMESKSFSSSDLSQPLIGRDFERIVNFASRVWASFDASYRSDFPLNVHAVCDADFEEFQCLNIRPGFAHEDYLLPVDNVRVVKGLADLEGWEPEQTVRLSLSLSRGEEGSLIPLGRALLKAKRPVIIDFGILSHPAMILRRIGCKLVPSYKVAGCLSADSYTSERRSLDVGLEPVERILSEAPKVESAQYHVVSDRDPISEVHWIGVSRSDTRRKSGAENPSEIARILQFFSQGRETFFFEKGRSEFCTSIFTTPREHFHLIKGDKFDRLVSTLVQRIGGAKFSELEAAYDAVPEDGPYVIFGTMEAGFWLATGRNSYEKGLLRTVFRLVGGRQRPEA